MCLVGIQRLLVIGPSQPVRHRLEGVHRDDLPAFARALGGVGQRRTSGLGSVVADDHGASAVRVPVTGMVGGRGRYDDDGVIGLMQQGVRHAAQRGAEAPQTARADDDLVGARALARARRGALGDRSLENHGHLHPVRTAPTSWSTSWRAISRCSSAHRPGPSQASPGGPSRRGRRSAPRRGRHAEPRVRAPAGRSQSCRRRRRFVVCWRSWSCRYPNGLPTEADSTPAVSTPMSRARRPTPRSTSSPP